MKKIIIHLSIISTLFLISLSPIYAQNTNMGGAPDPVKFNTQFSTLNNQIGTELNALTTPGLIISKLLPYLLTGAGLILFAMLIIGGFEIMTSTSDAKKADTGKQRITTAIVGFVIIFAAYWITQILEILFGIKIL